MKGKDLPKVEFAGVMSVIGPIVLGLFWLLAALGLVGVTVAVAVGQIPADSTGLGGITLLTVVVGAMSWVLIRDTRAVRTIALADDGTWILLTPLGLERGRIAPSESRQVHAMERRVWSFTATARIYTQSWVEIRTEKRCFTSCKNVQGAHTEVVKQLSSPPFAPAAA